MPSIEVIELKEGRLAYYVREGCIHITALSVKEEYRRKGVASIMIDMASQDTGLTDFSADNLTGEGEHFVRYSLKRNEYYTYNEL